MKIILFISNLIKIQFFKFDTFIDLLPRYQTCNSNNVTCQLCYGKGHKMKQIYYRSAIATCLNKYKIERFYNIAIN